MPDSDDENEDIVNPIDFYSKTDKHINFNSDTVLP